MSSVPRLMVQPVGWVVARWVVLVVTLALVAGLWLWPDPVVRVIWYALVPLLPATFLINGQLWRNVCPLATLNVLSGERVGERRLERRWSGVAGAAGIVLFLVLVPSRHFLLNTSAAALGVTLVLLCLSALLAGVLFDMKAGFCNAVCPILPVERLYGQRPMIAVPNARCVPCTACTRRGCADLAPRTAVVQMLGQARGPAAWVGTAYGIFALALPGVVVSFYLLEDVGLAGALIVYGIMAAGAFVSWGLLASVFTALKIPTARALIASAGLAATAYYWFAPAGTATAFGLAGGFTWTARIIAISLVLWWLVRALRDRDNPSLRQGA